MIQKRYISKISTLLSLVLVANLVYPAINCCLFLADCESMEMNHSMSPSMMNDHDEHSTMENMDMDSDHCDSSQNQLHQLVPEVFLTSCDCTDSNQISPGCTILLSKNTLSTPVRNLGNFEEFISEQAPMVSPNFSVNVYTSPPNLFIEFESLLI